MADIHVYYGIEDRYVDVTELAIKMAVRNNVLELPSTDCERARIFGDPIPGILKQLLITVDGVETVYPVGTFVSISLITGKMVMSPELRLLEIHSHVKLVGGSMKDELPEQLMAVRYIQPHNRVLEIGGNIGRNSLVIANLLDDQKNLVVLESNADIAKALIHNRDINGCTFHVEASALSKQKLAQKGWDTFPSETVPPGCTSVDIISFAEIESKYQIKFDALVADCEGALFYIFAEFPEMLDNINIVVMENDYYEIHKKQSVDAALTKAGFKVVYSQPGPWGACMANFFEVWSK